MRTTSVDKYDLSLISAFSLSLVVKTGSEGVHSCRVWIYFEHHTSQIIMIPPWALMVSYDTAFSPTVFSPGSLVVSIVCYSLQMQSPQPLSFSTFFQTLVSIAFVYSFPTNTTRDIIAYS